MSNDEELESVQVANDIANELDSKTAEGKSGMRRRLLVMLCVFVIAVGGIWGYREYLKSTIPKPDMNFVKKRVDGAEDDPEPSGLSVLSEILSGPQPSKEVTELQGKTAEEVVFTYDAIMNMSPTELEKNIKEVSDQLRLMRQSLPPSVGGASAGSSEPPQDNGTDLPGTTAEKKTVTVSSLALPLEVMRQVAEDK